MSTATGRATDFEVVQGKPTGVTRAFLKRERTDMSGQVNRRVVLTAGATTLIASPAIMRWPADAAEFEYKVANTFHPAIR